LWVLYLYELFFFTKFALMISKVNINNILFELIKHLL